MKKMIFLFIIITILLFNIESAYAVDALTPRVPANKLSEAKDLKGVALKNADSLAKSGEIFLGKGTCANCHGKKGRGDGDLADSFDPKPRNFTDSKWQKARTDGEIFWAIIYGTDYGMIAFDGLLSTEEIWGLVNYIRELGKEKSVK